jgi:hypothetical protein
MIRSFRFIIFLGLVLASLVADGITAGAFNINVLPREFVQIVERSPGILNAIGLEYWKKILDVSNAVRDSSSSWSHRPSAGGSWSSRRTVTRTSPG